MKEKGKNPSPREACIAVGDRRESKNKLQKKKKLHSVLEGIKSWKKIEQAQETEDASLGGLQSSGRDRPAEKVTFLGNSFIEI